MTESPISLPTDYQSFIHRSRYARYVDGEGRREFWGETVARYFDYFEQSLDRKHGYKVPASLRSELQDAVLGLNVMPSMRALMTAGPAAERENIAVYNCAYLPIDRPRAFAEVLYILMCGTGVGFSVERQVIARLPQVPNEFSHGGLTIVVGDSKMGWADAFEQLVINLYAGRIPEVDYSGIRAAGERLKVFGGRASGPDPLRKLFEFTIRMFRGAAGRHLNSLETHEIVTMTGETVIVGGVRRSAEISLSNLSDQRMRDAKSGNWWADKPHLGVANNSVAYTEKPEVGSFMDEWRSLYHSRSGERGIFNRYGAVQKMLRLGRRDHRFEFGTNPCGEIILRPRGLCNLTEIVARRSDGIADLKEKARLAAILGTWQSTQTDFNFVERDWQVNAEEERLLGVSITGIYDNQILRGDGTGGLMALGRHLTGLKESAIKANRMAAHEIGISPSVAVTTVKPSGTVSQLVGCTSGIHPARKKRYLRRVQGDNKDPLTQFMRDAGIPHVSHPEPEKSEKTTIFSFPVEVPADTPTLDQVSALDHMKLVACYNQHWSEHAISCTISVREHEWPAVGGWVYDHFDDIAGMSFLPHFTGDTGYCEDIIPELAVSAERFRAEQDRMPAAIAWSDLEKYEAGEDHVTGTREFACLGNACEITDASTPL